jgi:hypothetical protein
VRQRGNIAFCVGENMCGANGAHMDTWTFDRHPNPNYFDSTNIWVGSIHTWEPPAVVEMNKAATAWHIWPP